MATEAWVHEKATIGEGDQVANSLAARILLLQASITDVTAIKAVTDVIPNAGALTDISTETDKIASIKAVTDVLPDAGVLSSISDETDKIDQAATDGLTGTADSLAYRVHELERHFHNRERWWGAVAAPDETNACEANVTRPFVATSGDDTWGAAIPVCGTADDPTPGDGDTKFDLHRLLITDLDDDTDPWRIRIIWGTGTSGDAISAGQWTEMMVQSNAVPGNRAGGQPLDVIMRRVDVGAKIWCSVWNDSNGETLSFFVGCHGYVA